MISVIIPTYNNPFLLEATLASVVKQTLPGNMFEVFVCDDGGKNADAFDIVNKYKKYIDNLYYHWHKDNGFRAGECRNIGVKLSKFPYVFFLDTGVLLDKNTLQLHLRYHINKPNSALIGRVLGFSNYSDGNCQETCESRSRKLASNFFMNRIELDSFVDERDELYNLAGVSFNELPAPWLFFWTNHCSLEKKDFVSAGGFDTYFKTWGGEDTDLAISLFSIGVRFDIVPDSWSLDLPHVKINYESEIDKDMARKQFIEKQKYICGKYNLDSVRAWIEHPYETLNPYLLSL